MRVLLVLMLSALALGACGDDAEREAPGTRSATELTVTVNGRTSTVTDAKGVTPADLEPVGARRACTEIYGGDATATVRGMLDGKAVDAEFSLINGCEIARWERAAPLLGAPPTSGGQAFP